ncbi:hypothetical protein HPP92_006030 [Vanilla planifolia]|uniref:Uncharacterized protein n=1 Tax=Vanilla planifolia TaxID=51239 RepID=A0A835RVN0_VANPL|nr:hypothetical protein HPP92_006030 [Vanilla planifolia]
MGDVRTTRIGIFASLDKWDSCGPPLSCMTKFILTPKSRLLIAYRPAGDMSKSPEALFPGNPTKGGG